MREGKTRVAEIERKKIIKSELGVYIKENKERRKKEKKVRVRREKRRKDERGEREKEEKKKGRGGVKKTTTRV